MQKFSIDILDEDDLYPIIDKRLLEKFEVFKHILETMNNEQILSRTKASKFLNITPPTLDKYTKDRTIKGYHLAGRPVYKQSELLQSLKEIEVIKYKRG
jgi:hypothetical protein